MAEPMANPLDATQTLATWVAAGGTILAAFTAVYLAHRGNRVRLLTGVRIDRDDPRKPHLVFRVSNKSDRPVVIEGMAWKASPFSKSVPVVLSAWRPASSFGTQLAYGATGWFRVSFERNPMAKQYVNPRRRFSAWFLRYPKALVVTSVGQVRTIRRKRVIGAFL